MKWEKIKRADGRIEYVCEHGVGHGEHIHGCDGCCSREDYPSGTSMTIEEAIKICKANLANDSDVPCQQALRVLIECGESLIPKEVTNVIKIGNKQSWCEVRLEKVGDPDDGMQSVYTGCVNGNGQRVIAVISEKYITPEKKCPSCFQHKCLCTKPQFCTCPPKTEGRFNWICNTCHLPSEKFCTCEKPMGAGEHFVNGVNNTKGVKIGDCLNCHLPIKSKPRVEKMEWESITEDNLLEIVCKLVHKQDEIIQALGLDK